MQLHAVIRRMIDHVGDTNAERFGVAAPRVRVVAGKDRHITTATSGLVEKTASRGAILNRRNHFEQGGTDRQQRVLEAVLRDVAIAITHLETHDRGDVAHHRLKLACDQADLPQPHIAHASMALEGRRALLDKSARCFLVIGRIAATRMMQRLGIEAGFQRQIFRIVNVALDVAQRHRRPLRQ